MSYHYYRPKDKVSKLNDYFNLLDDLFHFEKGYSEEEFLLRIESSKSPDAPDTEYIFKTLINYGMIDESNDLISLYTLSHPYRTFFEYLYQDSQPVNSLIIQGYISTLEQQIDNIIKAYNDNSMPLIHRYLVGLGKEMDNISQTSSRNRLGVINEVRKLKVNEEKLNYKERLTESNRLWNEYLEPLREMISPSGSFSELMDKLKQTISIGETKFNGILELRRQFSISRSKRMSLNEQARHDLNEAQKELAPLREKLVQESRLLEASSIIFKQLEQGKLNDLASLSLGRILKHEGQINLFGMHGFLADLWQIKAEPEGIIFDEEDESIDPPPLEKDEVLSLLHEMPNKVDIMDFFLQQHEDLSANTLLRALSIAVLHQQEITVTQTNEEKEYCIQGQLWRGVVFEKGKKVN